MGQKSSLEFLTTNIVFLDSVNIDSSSTSFDAFKHQYRIFFTGEYHAIKDNSASQIAMIEYLYAKCRLRKVIMELPMSNTEFINAYILRANQDSLNMLKSTGGFNKEFKKLIDFLYDFNMRMNSKDRIEVLSIDVENDYYIPVGVLQRLLPLEDIPEEIKKNIIELKSFQVKKRSKLQTEEIARFIDVLSKDITLNSAVYEKYLGRNYPMFKCLLEGTKIGAGNNYGKKIIQINTPESLRNDSLFLCWREDFMYQNFLQILNTYSLEIFYGQFGKFHTSLQMNSENDFPINFMCLAARLQNNVAIRDSVCSIDIVYNKYHLESITNVTIAETTENHKNFHFDKKIVLFNLKGKDSPFLELSKKNQFLLLVN